MRTSFACLTVALLFVSGCIDRTPLDPVSSTAPRFQVEADGSVIPNQFIIGLHRGADVIPEARRLLSLMEGAELIATYEAAVLGFAVAVAASELEKIAGDGSVRVIAPDGIEETMLSTSGDQVDAPWNLDRVDQRDLPLDGLFRSPGTVAEVDVYVLDTGIRTSHDDFGGRATAPWDFHVIQRDGQDCQGHGSHVAGTVGGDVYGAAKSVRIIGIRMGSVGTCGSSIELFPQSQILQGYEVVAQARQNDPSRPVVLNASYGGTTINPVIEEAVANLIAMGVVFVAAAGNYRANACNFRPAGIPGVIAVGATDDEDHRAGFSNWGPCVDIFAPGVGILSAGWETDDEIVSKSGTSMAAPLVAGAAALFLSHHPDATPAEVRDALVALATRDRLSDLGEESENRLLFIPSVFGVIEIEIDILPGSSINPVNPGGRGTLPVAVLGGEFDPSTLDVSTIRLGDGVGAGVPVQTRPNGTVMASLEDVNRDGFLDLVLHFSIPNLAAVGYLVAGTTELVLTASTNDALEVRGVDAVVITP